MPREVRREVCVWPCRPPHTFSSLLALSLKGLQHARCLRAPGARVCVHAGFVHTPPRPEAPLKGLRGKSCRAAAPRAAGIACQPRAPQTAHASYSACAAHRLKPFTF